MMLSGGGGVPALNTVHRSRTVSSPVPGPYPGQPPTAPSPSPTLSRPLSPGLNYGERRESGGLGGGPIPIAINDSFTPPAALSRFHSALPQGAFLPSPAPLGPGGPRSLPPRHPPQNPMDTPTSAGGLENKRFARPGAPITVCTSPGATASSTPLVSPNTMRDNPPASPMD